ncbi:phosphate ABC transporter substrate-binding protein PstS [Arenivirga flava]|uniref:Phosphate-binding protein n=1 Tax=Arenivirga flava TaxID=1930060 RepID=A0AA37XDA3_9MICO|nr:phosphate ABC transporter substrate-binding protein PstS [Arenivirga flava]GMA29342.1 phosphate-binding protein PstS [Arenivirga flava]
MNIKRVGTLAALGLTSTLLLASCAANETPDAGSGGDSSLSGTISATGASSQETAQAAWVAAFQTANTGVTVDYVSTGSGPGRENFLAGASDFIGSDRAFNDEEIAAGGFTSCASDEIVELPLYVSPIAIIFNLEGVDSINLDAATVANIFNGTITTWNDPAIADQNEGVELPDTAITPVHRSDDSGTTENFTEYLNAVAPEAWTAEADGVWPLEGGESAEGTSGLVGAVEAGQGTIGYADASRAGDLGTVAVKVGEEYVPYSTEAVAAFLDSAERVEGRGEGDLALELDRTTTAAGVYPIALVSYLIGCVDYEDANTAELVSSYFSYIASAEGQDEGNAEAGSAPISDDLRAEVEAAIALIG